MSAWKPGDVALVYGPDNNWRIGIRALSNDGWFDDVGAHDADIEIQRVRPLVVIDPEDVETVERLRSAFWAGHNADVSGMQSALRSLLAPPKPDEPTGLGAVVEDSSGDRWIHVGNGCWSVSILTSGYAADEAPFSWQGIAAVRVLSEGVAE